jgi:hypothetical protein
MSLYGLGSFAGGLASGVMAGQRLSHNIDRQKREREEYEREQGWRREAGNTFGSVGTEREDGSVYQPEQAYEDFARLGAQYNPEKAMGVRTAGLQHQAAKQSLETGALQQAGIKRNERYAKNEEDVVEFLRKMQGAPDDQFYREASKFASRFGNDGKSFGVDFDANGGYSAVMIDTNSGEVHRQPIGSRQDVEQQLLSYASPQGYRQAQEHGLKERKLGQGDRQLEQGDKRLGIMQQQVDQQGRLIDAQSQAMRALANQRQQTAIDRMPEADKLHMQSLSGRKKNLESILAKPDLDPAKVPEMQRAYRQLLGEEYGLLKKHGLIPEGKTLSAYRGLPDPMQVVMDAINAADTEKEFLQSVKMFNSLYGDDPAAADAWNAMEDVRRDKFDSRVRPQNISQEGGLGIRMLPPGARNVFTQGAAAMDAAGIPLSAGAAGGMPIYGAPRVAPPPMGLAPQQRGQEVRGVIRR